MPWRSFVVSSMMGKSTAHSCRPNDMGATVLDSKLRLQNPTQVEQKCYHCGEACEQDTVVQDDKHFCCHGCATVYGLIASHDLCDYYSIKGVEEQPKLKAPSPTASGKVAKDYSFLDTDLGKSWLQYSAQGEQGHEAAITFFVPGMACASCLYLLNNLNKFNEGVSRSTAAFGLKQVNVWYHPENTSPSAIAQLMASLGYAPLVEDPSLSQDAKTVNRTASRSLLTRMGVAGFCAGNAMMLSFPAYLGLSDAEIIYLSPLLTGLNVLLALVVVFYSAWPYFQKSYTELKNGRLSVDLPIAMAITALFSHSMWDLTSSSGPGYLDSMAGLVFLLLIGLWMQTRYLENLTHHHSLGALFPLSVKLKRAGVDLEVPVSAILPKDEINLLADDMVPADATVLACQEAFLDTSFLTGESRKVRLSLGDKVLAGTILVSGTCQIKVDKAASQSYLINLWSRAQEKDVKPTALTRFTSSFVAYFTIITLMVASLTLLGWYMYEGQLGQHAWTSAVAVLMVACPCALTLAMPFSSHQAALLLAKAGLYVKSPAVVERLAQISRVVFDKTGTLTNPSDPQGLVVWKSTGSTTETEAYELAAAANRYNRHPLLAAIAAQAGPTSADECTDFTYEPGAGVSFTYHGQAIKLGSMRHIGVAMGMPEGSYVALAIDDLPQGYFLVTQKLTAGVEDIIKTLPKGAKLNVLTGDDAHGLAALKPLKAIRPDMELLPGLAPDEKMAQLQLWQHNDDQILMLGDGVNDGPALMAAHVGIALSSHAQAFTPAADAVAQAKEIGALTRWLAISKGMLKAVHVGLLLSLLYNVVGVGLAAMGWLSPWFAAAFMPLSSLSVVALSVLLTRWWARPQLSIK